MPNIDHHAAVSTLRARYNLARKHLEQRDAASPSRLEALDALQGAMEGLAPSTLSCTSWQRAALTLFNLAFAAGSEAARRVYAGGLLVYGHSTGTTWAGAWKDALLDAA